MKIDQELEKIKKKLNSSNRFVIVRTEENYIFNEYCASEQKIVITYNVLIIEFKEQKK